MGEYLLNHLFVIWLTSVINNKWIKMKGNRVTPRLTFCSSLKPGGK